MYPKMLKYIIVLCIISFCDSTRKRIVGEYHRLQLIQHSPVASFFMPGKQNVNTSDHNFLQYLAEHWIMFDDKSWIIQGLQATNRLSMHLTGCVNSLGEKLIYGGKLHWEFIGILKGKWPNVKPNQENEVLWRKKYNKYGSCVSVFEMDYFEMAVEMLNNYNVGTILDRAGIYPEQNYTLGRIVDSIGAAVQKRFFMKCLQPRRTEIQYLAEVQLCFEGRPILVDCYPAQRTHGIIECDESRDVYYPGMPKN